MVLTTARDNTYCAVMNRIADIIGLWPTVIEFAADVGVPETNSRAWKARNSIPPRKWNAVVMAAAARGFRGVNIQLLADLAERADIRSEAA